jgi:hypothetical protein
VGRPPATPPKSSGNGSWSTAQPVRVIPGGVMGTCVRIAPGLADAFDRGCEARVVPVTGQRPVGNVEDLLLLRGIDIAAVQSDVLDCHERAHLDPGIEGEIACIATPYDDEIQLLARGWFSCVDDLPGPKASSGPRSSMIPDMRATRTSYRAQNGLIPAQNGSTFARAALQSVVCRGPTGNRPGTSRSVRHRAAPRQLHGNGIFTVAVATLP